MYKFCDSHCHPSDEQFDKILVNHINEAKEKGLVHIVGVAEGYMDSLKLLRLADEYPIIHPCVGIHPWIVHTESMDEMTDLIESNHKKIVGIGEIGLDYAKSILERSENMLQLQHDYFNQQLELAKDYDIPVNVHSRYAGHYSIEMIKKMGLSKVHLHAYDGSIKSVKQGIASGYYFSIPSSIQNSDTFQRLAKTVPLSNMLLETDSPAMSASSVINTFIAANSISSIKAIPIDQVYQTTTFNCVHLYNL